jgi:hypothetical protein
MPSQFLGVYMERDTISAENGSDRRLQKQNWKFQSQKVRQEFGRNPFFLIWGSNGGLSICHANTRHTRTPSGPTSYTRQAEILPDRHFPSSQNGNSDELWFPFSQIELNYRHLRNHLKLHPST